MPSVELSAGSIDFDDTGGTGPVVVLLHGVMMDGRQWDRVVPLLADRHRCIRPTLPLGAHRRHMRHEADLTLRGQAHLVAEFLDALDLRHVTLCFNDWAAPQILVADGLTDRVAGMVLASCETAGNYPPGLAGKNLALLGVLPGGIAGALRALSWRPLRGTPMTFGWMAKHGIPDDLLDHWLRPATTSREIRSDLRKYIGTTRQGRRDLVAATRHLHRFDRPVRVVWAADDRLMPREEGRRLAMAFPQGEFALVEDSYTLLPLDQPQRLASEIRDLVARTSSRDPSETRVSPASRSD